MEGGENTNLHELTPKIRESIFSGFVKIRVNSWRFVFSSSSKSGWSCRGVVRRRDLSEFLRCYGLRTNNSAISCRVGVLAHHWLLQERQTVGEYTPTLPLGHVNRLRLRSVIVQEHCEAASGGDKRSLRKNAQISPLTRSSPFPNLGAVPSATCST